MDVVEVVTIPAIDVELMPASQAATTAPFSFTQLSRRDFAVFSIGAGAGAIATFFGCLLAVVATRRGQTPATTQSGASPTAPAE
jgi:hypothetical protein